MLLRVSCLGLLLPISCGWLPIPPPTSTANLVINASVTEVDPATGLPQMLVGTITGDFVGTYSEEVLEVFFDADGVPASALSVSQFTFAAPNEGTLTSTNLTLILGPILQLDENGDPVVDENGDPVVIGLRTAATGDLVDGTGAFEMTSGDLQTDSDVLLSGGDMGLGETTTFLRLHLRN